MAPTPEINSYEAPLDKKEVEKKSVIDESKEKEKSLKDEIILKRSFSKINFHLDTTSITADGASIIRKLREKYNNDDSLEGALLGNPQIQNLLGNAVSGHAKQWNNLKTKRALENKKDKEDEDDGDLNVERWEDFELRESSPEKFEEWLLTPQGINALRNEIEDHLDENGNLIKGYSINEKDLRISLEKARYINLLTNYNLKYNIFDDENKKYMKNMGFLVHNKITSIVKEQLTSGGSFDKKMVENLEALLTNQNAELAEQIKKNPNIRDEFKKLLKGTITRYSNYVVGENKVNLNTGTPKQDLLLRSYLFIYGKSFFPDNFKLNKNSNSFDGELTEVMEAILIYDGELNQLKHNKYLNEEKKAEEDRKKRDKQRRIQASKRNGSDNSDESNGAGNGEKHKDSDTSDNKEKKGADYAENVYLGDYNVNDGMSDISGNEFVKQQTFVSAWNSFKGNTLFSEDGNDIKVQDILTREKMIQLYKIKGNSISLDEAARKTFVDSETIQGLGLSQDEINKIYDVLNTFPNAYNSALKGVLVQANKQKGRLDDMIRNNALGSVIDNVVFVFADIVEKWEGDSNFKGFKFDGSDAVKREGDDIIISGTFNGTPIKIRYDLVSGGLFMNSFLHYQSPSKVTIGDNNTADLQIGQLESFDKILDEHYRAPEISLPNRNNSQAQSRGNQASPTQTQGITSGTESGIDLGTDSGLSREGKEGEDANNTDERLQALAEQRFNKENSQVEVLAPEERLNNSTISPSQSQTSLTSSHEIKSRNSAEIQSIKNKYREMLFKNLKMISDAVVDNTKKQNAKNSSITKFLKTFNILGYDGGFQSVDFNEGSNLFRFIKIVDETGNDQSDGVATLEYFENTFMPLIMEEYSGLKWGENNMNQDKTKKLFTNENDNESLKILKSKIGDFNPNSFRGVGNFDSSHQLGFADFIIENLLNESGTKLNIVKMMDFVNSLKNGTHNSNLA